MPTKKKAMKATKVARREMDIDDFAADTVDAVSDMNAWLSFLRVMEGKGYSEADVEEGCSQIAKRAGRIG
jgi:hypothetical protein